MARQRLPLPVTAGYRLYWPWRRVRRVGLDRPSAAEDGAGKGEPTTRRSDEYIMAKRFGDGQRKRKWRSNRLMNKILKVVNDV
ncbi:hypothetical protein BBO_08042 [Beauveria brongniartii RCEF 3172]|uniref:Uncharacterized protein n=1 Tax=Beauveria brongniartii RCEF 3172 TaxID=1081107 RepID=A0A166YCS1_9HYPO|nr:hypothetical protein BBO_08042 [Beauveria brongniartii RCEF 3172]